MDSHISIFPKESCRLVLYPVMSLLNIANIHVTEWANPYDCFLKADATPSQKSVDYYESKEGRNVECHLKSKYEYNGQLFTSFWP